MLMVMNNLSYWLDMRKSMPRDVTGETSVETGKVIEPDELEWN